jgi:hypothetical protein
MSTEVLEVVCDEHGIGGGTEFCGENDEQLGRINVLYTTRPRAASTFPAQCL